MDLVREGVPIKEQLRYAVIVTAFEGNGDARCWTLPDLASLQDMAQGCKSRMNVTLIKPCDLAHVPLLVVHKVGGWASWTGIDWIRTPIFLCYFCGWSLLKGTEMVKGPKQELWYSQCVIMMREDTTKS